MRELAALVSHRGSASNLGDRLLQEILRRFVQDRGAFLLVQRGAAGGAENAATETCRTPFILQLSLLKAALRGRITGDPRATVFLPPGQSLIKTPGSLPRIAAQLAYLCLLKSLGVRIVSLGRDFSGRSLPTRLHERVLARLADYYGLRDGAALARAREMGVRNAVWFPDLSWLDPAPDPATLTPFPERHSVVLCFRTLTGHLRADRRGAESFVGAIVSLMDEAGALGLKECVLVSHDHSDQQMVTAIRERSRPGHRLRCLPQILTRADIPEVYGRAALVLSNRLHALLLGLQYGAVALALVRASSQPKITGQLADIGLGDHIIDTETSSPPPGIVRFTVDRHREINRVVDAYRDKALTTGRLAFASLFP